MNSIFQTQVSFYPSGVNGGGEIKKVSLADCLLSSKWRDVVNTIRAEPDEAEQKKMKSQLPCFTPSGLFTGKKACDLVEHSGFISLDLDEKDNRDCADFRELKRLIKECPNVTYCGLSVRGKGYVCLVPIADPKKHRDYFRALCADFAACGLKVDSSGADVSRKRFVSYDPEPYINTAAAPYDHVLPCEDRPEARKMANVFSGALAMEGQLAECISRWAEKTEKDITGGYPQWFEILCALASTFGEDGRDYAHRISQYGDYDPGETDRQYTECLEHGGYNYTFATFLYYARKGMGDEEYGRIRAALDFEDIIFNDKEQ